MLEQKIDIPTPDGEADSEFYTPEGKGPWPGVIYLTDIWGLRPATEKMARRVAGEGYAVLLPNIFYRTNKPPIDPLLKGQERGMEVAGPLLASMNAERMVADGIAYADYLLARADVGKPGASAGAGATNKKVAVVGYCFSGAMAVRLAAAIPEKIAAAASFHGGGLVTDRPDSPHTLIPEITAELYFGHAVEDQSATPRMVAQLDAALKGWGGTYQSEVYEGARHGWTVEGPVYNPAQSERHFEKLFDLLQRTLK
jgi:carboxymethylenebutenolidase